MPSIKVISVDSRGEYWKLLTPAEIASFTNVEMRGRSRMFGRCLISGVTDTSTAGTPINVNVS